MLLPTHSNWPYPFFFFLAILEIFKAPTTDRFTLTSTFLPEALFSVADNVLKYYIITDSILDHILSTVKENLYPIQKKCWPTYLPILRLMGRSTANKKYFKDGLRCAECSECAFRICSNRYFLLTRIIVWHKGVFRIRIMVHWNF